MLPPNSTILFDRSNWGHISLTGADRVRFLHNQTTQNIQQLSPGQGAHTVFVTSTGRTIDLAAAYLQADAIHLIVSPNMAAQLYDWMDRYIFFSDKVTLNNESDRTFTFTLLGDRAGEIVTELGASTLPEKPKFGHQTTSIAGVEISIAANSDLALPGYTLWGELAQKETIQQAIAATSATTGTPEQWEDLRIRQGRPMPNQELTEDDNPLEAGLWHSVSFEKGCYIGQETIARLHTYKGVKKRLWGLQLEQPVPVGATVQLEDNKIGKVTSLTTYQDNPFALAYIRTKAGGEGLAVAVDSVEAQVVPLPFVTHEYPEIGENNQ